MDLPDDQEPLVERNGRKVEHGGEDSLREGGRGCHSVSRHSPHPIERHLPCAGVLEALTTALSRDYCHHLRDIGTSRGGRGWPESTQLIRDKARSSECPQPSSASFVSRSPCEPIAQNSTLPGVHPDSTLEATLETRIEDITV